MFFFSSRRRHTRSDRDWSSDVCSSDLWGKGKIAGDKSTREVLLAKGVLPDFEIEPDVPAAAQFDFIHRVAGDAEIYFVRSEERRVGKECRSRGWPYH